MIKKKNYFVHLKLARRENTNKLLIKYTKDIKNIIIKSLYKSIIKFIIIYIT